MKEKPVFAPPTGIIKGSTPKSAPSLYSEIETPSTGLVIPKPSNTRSGSDPSNVSTVFVVMLLQVPFINLGVGISRAV